LDWLSYAIDERRHHPVGVYKAECGHLLMMIGSSMTSPTARLAKLAPVSSSLARWLAEQELCMDLSPGGGNAGLTACRSVLALRGRCLGCGSLIYQHASRSRDKQIADAISQNVHKLDGRGTRGARRRRDALMLTTQPASPPCLACVYVCVADFVETKGLEPSTPALQRCRTP
jgi:hypothetical protein